MPAAASTYKPSKDVLVTEVDGEAVLLHVAAGAYYGLDEVGTEVWRMLESGTPADRIVRNLLERYDVEEPRLRSDVERLLGDLEKARLIESV